ncbi:MAG TPA: YraN family protein [Actinomycetota bacterium]|nr:YraN family protein [Actinomycetota bacterium]
MAASTDPRAGRGRAGEDATADVYRRRGYRILARNWRCPLGEIDLIARRQDVVVICEVKSRSGVAFGGGYESVTWSKRRRLRHLAEAFLAERRLGTARVRFDVASVWLGRRGSDVEIFEDAF